MSNNVIEIKGLKKSYKNVSVLKGLDLEVEEGTMVALLGPNGAGKTTTVRILSTLLSPDEGTIKVKGFDVVKDARKVRANIGLTGQYAAVDEFLTGRENLLMMGRLYHLSSADSSSRATELLQIFEIEDAADRAVKTYSGGMRRRLDLALSLIATPPVLFLDEPTTGLDPRSRLKIWDIIERLLSSGVTILLTTQYLEEADKLADKIAVLDEGKIIALGTADELKQKAGKERLEIVIEKGYDFDQAVKIIGGEDVRIDRENRLISTAAEGTVAHIQRTLNSMEKAKIEIETLSLHKPTLDDVFLKLTGHGALKNEETEVNTQNK